MDSFQYIPGTVPIIISMPHTGTHVPDGILARFTPEAKQLPDTDWHISRLYDFAPLLGCHMLIPACSRYVIDLNRPEDDASLYPGKFTTGLIPMTLFDGSPLYQGGYVPDAAEIATRKEQYWRPYHTKLAALVEELKAQHGKVVVFDAHSIRSEVSTLFDGVLPDLNIGTADSTSADIALSNAVVSVCNESPYSYVYNGRFKGGYITRHYGRPDEGIHAIQLELAQKNYMDENAPFAYDMAKAVGLQATLANVIYAIGAWVTT
jgi:N-formylglutamate deformylase